MHSHLVTWLLGYLGLLVASPTFPRLQGNEGWEQLRRHQGSRAGCGAQACNTGMTTCEFSDHAIGVGVNWLEFSGAESPLFYSKQ